MSMYNKLFAKILDSSIWMEDDSTRLVWLTLLAAMDEDGFASFASPVNLAHRARVSAEACSRAIEVLEGPDANSSDSDNEGRRIERVPGGWMVLNAIKYQELVTRVIAKERTRMRVKKHRLEKAKATQPGSPESEPCNADVTVCNAHVTPSDRDKDSDSDTKLSLTHTSESNPTIEEFTAYMVEKAGLTEEYARMRWGLLDSAGWVNGSGMPIRKWQSLAPSLTKFFREEQFKKQNRGPNFKNANTGSSTPVSPANNNCNRDAAADYR